MERHRIFWGWTVFVFSFGGYVPAAIGGWQHPSEVNVAAYSLWFILAGTFLYASRAQGFAGWRLPFGWLVGNAAIIVLAFWQGGHTFNLGPTESIALYGLITTVGAWVAVGQVTGKWDPRILFLGSIVTDILSFYPQIKQYLMPHEPPTCWLLAGWCMWLTGVSINLLAVDRLWKKLRMPPDEYRKSFGKDKKALLIVEESVLSLENGLFIMITLLIMFLA